MIVLEILLLTLAIAPQTLSLSCCDSILYPIEELTSDRKVAAECPRKTFTTRPRDPMQRHKGFAGKDCDFCTVEFFHKKGAQGKPDDQYYLQSCGR